jgi:hypothetical protein
MLEKKIDYTVDYTLTDISDVYTSVTWLRKAEIPIVALGLLCIIAAVMLPQISWVWLCGVCLISMPVGCRLRLAITAKKTLASQGFSSQQEICFDEVGVITKSHAFESKMNWTQFHAWRETPTAILLYMTPYVFLIVPKRCLPGSELDSARELFSLHVQKYKPSTRNRTILIVGFAAIMIVSFLFGLLSARH